MNNYDLTFILDGKLTPAKRKSTLEKIDKVIELFEGKITKTQDLGEKVLAYPIKKLTSGAYYQYNIDLSGENARKLNDKLRLEESILRYLFVRS